VGWKRFHFDAMNSANIDPYQAPETPPEDLACHPLWILLRVQRLSTTGCLVTLEAELVFAK
jgi:hypothetical protein